MSGNTDTVYPFYFVPLADAIHILYCLVCPVNEDK